jgi:nucleotide-binding universal stress UspA family protein
MASFDTILVPTDGSEHALRAAEHGAALARVFGASVHLINVIDLRSVAGPFSAGGLEAETRTRLETEAEDDIEKIVDRIDVPGEVRWSVKSGTPVNEIFAYCDEHDVDLITMGTHGRTGVQRYVMGSVTESVVRRASVPVLTVRATERSRDVGYDEILLPTDGSEFATVAVEPTLAIAKRFDARVHVLSVVDIGDMAVTGDYGPAEELLERVEADATAETEAIADRARDRGLDATTHVQQGFPAAALLDYAVANDVDMIGMGTAGRTGMNRFLLGSTTERVIRHAEMPVLAVNARDERED